MIDTNELRRLAQAATPGPWINHGRQPNVAGLPHSAVAAKTLLARVYSEAYGDVEQETANASFIAAANPAAISELLDRIEAAEKERDALRAELAGLRSSMEFRTSLIGRTEAERDALRAKIEAMERQEPLDAGSDVFRSAFEAALKAGNWPATRQGDGYRSPSTQIAWRIAFSTVNRLKLYLAPGAKGE